MKIWHWMQLSLGLLLGLILTALGFLPLSPVQAQSETIIAIIPEVSHVPLGCQVRIELMVENGVDVNAFDVKVRFNSDRIKLLSWEKGEYLSRLSVVKEDVQPGYLWLAATQLATGAVSGDGILLVLIFETNTMGKALIEIEDAVFADPEGNTNSPDRQNGEVTVTSEPTYTRTPTPTLETTPKETVIPTLTGTIPFTPTFTRTKNPAPSATQTLTFTQTPRTNKTATKITAITATMTPVESLTQTERMEEPSPTPEGTTPGPNGRTLTPTVIVDDELGATDEILLIQTAIARRQHLDAGGSDDEVLASNYQTIINVCLWGILIGGVVAIVFMILILMRRKKRENEDLLL